MKIPLSFKWHAFISEVARIHFWNSRTFILFGTDAYLFLMRAATSKQKKKQVICWPEFRTYSFKIKILNLLRLTLKKIQVRRLHDITGARKEMIGLQNLDLSCCACVPQKPRETEMRWIFFVSSVFPSQEIPLDLLAAKMLAGENNTIFTLHACKKEVWTA